MVAGGRRLAMALPVVLDVDDAGAAEELGVEVGGFRADDALDFADAGNRRTRQPPRQVRGADVVHLFGGVHAAGGLMQEPRGNAGLLEADPHPDRALIAEDRETLWHERTLEIGKRVGGDAGVLRGIVGGVPVPQVLERNHCDLRTLGATRAQAREDYRRMGPRLPNAGPPQARSALDAASASARAAA